MLQSTKHARAGEEVTIDYNFDQGTVRQTCRCGSQGCRGWLHRLPKGAEKAAEEKPEEGARAAETMGGAATREEKREGEEDAGNDTEDEDRSVVVVSDGSL